MTAQRQFDVISLGAMSLALHAQQPGARLEDVASFAKDVGGTSAAIAFGCARLGLRVAMLSRVGDDPAGRFLVEALAAEGCDVSHVALDRERPTALALLGMRGDESAPQMRYREGCADLAIDEGAVEESWIAAGRALVLTGAHFATELTDRISSLALERARRHGVRTVLDIDYDPERWGLTRPGAGANRHVAERGATAHVQAILGRFDLVVGTRAEIQLAGGSDDLLQALRAIRRATPATLVVKLGAAGCAIFDEHSESLGVETLPALPVGPPQGGDRPGGSDGEVPAHDGDLRAIPGFAVEAVNRRGAGDAFLAGLLKGWLAGMDWPATGRMANACGALVVARPAAAAAMPTAAELAYFMASASGAALVQPDRDPQLVRLHRGAARRRTCDELCLVAIDDRAEDFALARDAGAAEARLAPLKQLVVSAVAKTEQAMALQGRVSVGVLVDDSYGAAALLASAGRGWWLGRPVEVPGSLPLELEGGRSIGSRLTGWPREQVVTCRVRFHPDEPVEDRLEQETQLAALYSAVVASGHELLLEVSPPSTRPGDDDTIVRALKRLYNIGIYPGWWSLAAMPAQTWRKLDELIAERDRFCRGVLLVDHEDGPTSYAELAAAAASRSCCGFFVGRAALRSARAAWLAGSIDDDRLVAQVHATFAQRIRAWQHVRTTRDGAR